MCVFNMYALCTLVTLSYGSLPLCVCMCIPGHGAGHQIGLWSKHAQLVHKSARDRWANSDECCCFLCMDYPPFHTCTHPPSPSCVLSPTIVSICLHADSLDHCHHKHFSPSPHVCLLPLVALSPYLSLLGVCTLSPFPMPLPACSFPQTFTLSHTPFLSAHHAAWAAVTLSTFITLHSFPQW